MKKSEIVKSVYRAILNAIDAKEIDTKEDILVVKRRFFTESYNKAIEEFAILGLFKKMSYIYPRFNM